MFPGETNPNAFYKEVGLAWGEVLGREPAAGENFFEVGGNSITAVLLASVLSNRLSMTVSPLVLLQTETFAELVEELVAIKDVSPGPIADPASASERETEVSALQERWFHLSREGLGNVEFLVRVEGDVYEEDYQAALTSFISEHRILQSKFRADGSTVMQVRAIDHRPTFAWKDVSALPPELQRSALQAAVDRSSRPFDLTAEYPFECEIVRGSEGDFIVGHAHHILFDGWSIGIMIDDLIATLTARKSTGSLATHDSPTDRSAASVTPQYEEFAARQNRYLRSDEVNLARDHFRELFDGTAGPTRIISTLKEEAESSVTKQSSYADAVLDAQRTKVLREAASERKASLFALLVGALARLLAEEESSRDVIFGVSNAGRFRSGEEGTVGVFVRPLPVRFPSDVLRDSSKLIRWSKERVLDFAAWELYPLTDLIREVPPFNSSDEPPFYVHLIYQNHLARSYGNELVRMRPFDLQDAAQAAELRITPPPSVVLRDLEIIVYDLEDGGLSLNFGFDPSLHNEDSVGDLVNRYSALICQFATELMEEER